MELDEKHMLYDWNTLGADIKPLRRRVEFDDETLRDGLQNPSVVDPHIEDKKRILHLMNDLGIQAADIGLPGAGPRAVEDVIALAQEIVDAKLSIRPNCAARTHKNDITPIIEISNKVGIPIEACTFLGSSPIRQYVEDWDIDRMLRLTEEAVDFAVKGGLLSYGEGRRPILRFGGSRRDLYHTTIQIEASSNDSQPPLFYQSWQGWFGQAGDRGALAENTMALRRSTLSEGPRKCARTGRRPVCREQNIRAGSQGAVPLSSGREAVEVGGW